MRTYEKSHPWLTFQINLKSANPQLWIALGEAQSKCEHIAGVPLRPDITKELHRIFLAKGIQATTAIEGNTLTEGEVLAQIDGTLKLPPSQEYLGQEITNILTAANSILNDVVPDGPRPISVDIVKQYNKMVLEKLPLEDHVIPGRIREIQVGVSDYRCAPWEDCEFLLTKLCDWLNGEDFKPAPGLEIVYGVIKSIVSHLYFVWIHPFGDGNGRTARLLEVHFLLEAGVPSAAAHLLSNHYNLTRSEYYRQLSVASKSGGEVIPFIEYAVRGFVDQLREQLGTIREQQLSIAWINHVHDRLGEPKTKAERRRLKLVLALSKHKERIPRKVLRHLSPELAEAYAGTTPKTLSRDLNALRKSELISETPDGCRARKSTILAFLPARMRQRRALRERKSIERRQASSLKVASS